MTDQLACAVSKTTKLTPGRTGATHRGQREPLVHLIRVPQLRAGKIVQRPDGFDTLPTGQLLDGHVIIGQPGRRRLGTRHRDHLPSWLSLIAMRSSVGTASENDDDSSSQRRSAADGVIEASLGHAAIPLKGDR